MTEPETHIESDLEYAERVAKINMEGVDSMTEPMDTFVGVDPTTMTEEDKQEMLAEYGAVKLADDKNLDHYIEGAERKINTYRFDIEQINDFGFKRAKLLSDVKEDLEKANLPVTEQTVLAFINAYIERASEGIEIAKEERR